MAKQKETIKDVAKAVDNLARITKESFELVDKRFDKVDKRFEKVDKRFNKVDKRFAELEYNLKVYVDDKLSGVKGDIIATIKGDRERDRLFKTKLLQILKRCKLAKQKELELLSELIR